MRNIIHVALAITFTVFNVHAANWLDRVKQTGDTIKQKAEETKENAQRSWQENERKCLDCGKVVHGRDRCVECESKRLSEEARQISERAREKVTQAKRTWDENKDRWAESARQQAQSAGTAISEFANNPAKQREVLQKVAEFKRDLDITLIKSVPVVDPKTGNLIPFGLMAENLVREAGIGGNFGADPVRTAYLMMIDSDYLFNGAQLIESPSGGYLSLNQAMSTVQSSPAAFNRSALESASGASIAMRSAYQSGDSVALSRASREFTDAISILQPSHRASAIGQHTQFWACLDSGLATIVGSTSGFYESISRFFYSSLGANHDLGQLLAVLVMTIFLIIILIALRRILTIGLRHQLICAEKDLRELEGSEKETASIS